MLIGGVLIQLPGWAGSWKSVACAGNGEGDATIPKRPVTIKIAASIRQVFGNCTPVLIWVNLTNFHS